MHLCLTLVEPVSATFVSTPTRRTLRRGERITSVFSGSSIVMADAPRKLLRDTAGRQDRNVISGRQKHRGCSRSAPKTGELPPGRRLGRADCAGGQCVGQSVTLGAVMSHERLGGGG